MGVVIVIRRPRSEVGIVSSLVILLWFLGLVMGTGYLTRLFLKGK